MNISNHYKMTKSLSDNLGIAMEHREHFLLGSIYPDISMKYIFSRHIYETSKEHIKEILNAIFIVKDEAYASFLMGVFTHYVMDAFCKYHTSDRLFDMPIKHLFYESLLNLRSKRLIRDYTAFIQSHKEILYDIAHTIYINNKNRNILDFIEDRIDDYYNNKCKETTRDIHYAMHTSYITLMVIQLYRNNMKGSICTCKYNK